MAPVVAVLSWLPGFQSWVLAFCNFLPKNWQLKLKILLIFINLIGFKERINPGRWLQLTPRVVPQGNEMSIRISFGNGEDPDAQNIQ